MRKYLLLLFLIITSWLYSFGQDLKRVYPVYIEINSKNPDKYIYGDDKVSIKFLDIQHDNVKIEIGNLTDKNIEFISKKSYIVVDGVSNVLTSAYTYLTNEIIPKRTKVLWGFYPDKLFNSDLAKKFYKKNRTPIINKLVFAFIENDVESEIVFNIKVYPKKIQ